jgi:hypothetical protein
MELAISERKTKRERERERDRERERERERERQRETGIPQFPLSSCPSDLTPLTIPCLLMFPPPPKNAILDMKPLTHGPLGGI